MSDLRILQTFPMKNKLFQKPVTFLSLNAPISLLFYLFNKLDAKINTICKTACNK